MSVDITYRSGVLSRVGVTVANVTKVRIQPDIEHIALETLDGTVIDVYGGPGFLATLMVACENAGVLSPTVAL